LRNLQKKFKESFFSVFPVTLIILAISLLLIDVHGALLVKFSISAVLLFVGIALFSLGVDQSIMPIGQGISSSLTKSKKIWLLCIACVVMGFIITIAEPDLMVLAEQIPINKWLFIVIVGIGVSLCFLLGVMRILFKIPLAYILGIGYGLIFLLMVFVPKSFWAVAFDASGVTTGAISVPFILSFCLGISALRSGKSSEDDSFGLVAVCSMGPIFSTLIMGLFTKDFTVVESSPVINSSYSAIAGDFGWGLLHSLKDIALVMLPIIVVFLIFQFTMMKLPKKQFIKILLGLAVTYLGIVIFMTGVNVGFSELGFLIGEKLMQTSYSWVAYPVNFLLGFVIVLAEPAVHVLVEQVAEISGNTISKRTMRISLCLGFTTQGFLPRSHLMREGLLRVQ